MPCADLRSEVKTGYIRPFAPAVLRGKEIRKFAAEKCQSGRSGLTRNQVYLHGYRGFESLLFRTAQGPHTEAHRTGPAGPVFLRPNAPPGPARAARKGRKKPAACAACGGKVRFSAPASPRADAPPPPGNASGPAARGLRAIPFPHRAQAPHRSAPNRPSRAGFFAPKRAAGPRTRGEKRAQKARRMRSVRREGALSLAHASPPPPLSDRIPERPGGQLPHPRNSSTGGHVRRPTRI